MTVANTLLIAGLIAGGLGCLGLGLALLAARRGDSWMAGYHAGKIAGQAQPDPQPPAPVIVLTQPTPAQPTTIDAAWRPVQQTARRFVIVGETEGQPRRLSGGAK